MSNVIAVIWDCDQTLIDGYMQDPIFQKYSVDSKEFWIDVEKRIKNLSNTTNTDGCENRRVNRDTYYLNYFIECARNGKFPGLNNSILREVGKEQKFFPGIPEIFAETKNMFKDNAEYSEYGIQVEHYIVSTGFAETIRGSVLAKYVDGIWGCELQDALDPKGNKILNEILYTIDNTTKTRAIFEINKGITELPDIDVNAKIPYEMRRVQFKNMIYIADGPSDIPAFSLIHQFKGNTFAVYPKGNMDALKQVEEMRQAGRVDMYAEADYSKNTTAYLWIINKIQQIANRIRNEEKEKILKSTSGVPHHLT